MVAVEQKSEGHQKIIHHLGTTLTTQLTDGVLQSERIKTMKTTNQIKYQKVLVIKSNWLSK